jgi:hypothetical protein
VGKGCGPIKSYGQDLSLCCDNGTSVMACDSLGISITAQLCPKLFGCVTHGTFGKRSGQGGIFAQCEKIGV